LSTALHIFLEPVTKFGEPAAGNGRSERIGSLKEGVMGLPINRLPHRLPRRFPIGATFVLEGYGGGEGNLRVIARYVVLPDGQRINVPAFSLQSLPRALAFRRRPGSKRSAKARTEAAKKYPGRRGTK